MSSDCEYRRVAIRFDKDRFDLKADLIVRCMLTGSNNLYNHRGDRVRKWEASAIGTEAEVMRDVIWFAGSCEGQSLRMDNFGDSGYVTPETYIKRWRRVIANAKAPDADDRHRDRVRVLLRLRVFDHEAARFDQARRALLAELESSSLPCGKATAWSTTCDESGQGQYERLPARMWSFPDDIDVALFEKYRYLKQFGWSDAKVYGPGEA